MGKSPGKWIKTVLFGKKSSKSSGGKVREKTGNEREVLVGARASEVDVISVPTVISHPTTIISTRDERKLEVESKETANLQHDGELSGNHDSTLPGSTPEDAVSDVEKEQKERAATMAQAAFRGYLARRAFRALKGIIRLQALIRGHLVRRQAVATLCSVMGIVKLQALARGNNVRNSDIGKNVSEKCNLVKLQEGKLVDSNQVNISIQLAKMSPNAFVRKLLAPSPTVMPLRLYYDPEEPNSVSNWLERWSASYVWKPAPQRKRVASSKTQKKQVGNGQMVEAETGRPKRSVRRVPAANTDNNVVQASSEFERPKRNFRKVSSHPADSVQDNPQNELEKVKSSLRKVHNPVVENSAPLEVEAEKPKQSLEKVSGTSGDNVVVQSINNSGEKMRRETTVAASKLPDAVKNEPPLTKTKSDGKAHSEKPDSPDAKAPSEPLEVSKPSDLSPGETAMVESKPSADNIGHDENIPITNGELINKEDPTSNQGSKSSKKASVHTKQERAENGLHSSPTLPSYMAATESAKAKLRGQGSPRFSQDGTEKNNATRRHSLPSSNNSKISSESPRTQRAVHGSGKGGSKSDRSMLSSRDGNAKAQTEWRR